MKSVVFCGAPRCILAILLLGIQVAFGTVITVSFTQTAFAGESWLKGKSDNKKNAIALGVYSKLLEHSG